MAKYNYNAIKIINTSKIFLMVYLSKNLNQNANYTELIIIYVTNLTRVRDAGNAE